MTVANAVGNGVADDKLIYTYMPDLIRYYLAEEPILENVESYRLDDPEVLDWVLCNAESLVLKPVDGAGGAGIVIGPTATADEIAAVKVQVAANPRGWMAQRPVALSTSPVLMGEKLRPAHIDLRPFAVNDGNDVWVLPGGLTRVALPEGELKVNSSQGGGSKDTWVLDATVRSDESLRASATARRAAPPPADRRWPSSAGERPRAVNSELLSRIAETLYWTGRYVERADDTARLIDVYVHRMLGETGADSDAACRALFGILGVPVEPDAEQLDVDMVLFRLVFEAQAPSAIAGSMLGARAGARGIREVISSEMWECLNVTAHGLSGQKRAAERLGPHVYLRYIRERAALFFGLADSTMSHDDAWRFLVLGRSLERADMTARLLLARMSAPDDLGWTVLLRACGAHESFIRTHGWAADSDPVAEFLLLDRLFPSSVVFALTTAEECLAALNPGAVRAGVDDPARRPVGRLRNRLEYATRSSSRPSCRS